MTDTTDLVTPLLLPMFFDALRQTETTEPTTETCDTCGCDGTGTTTETGCTCCTCHAQPGQTLGWLEADLTAAYDSAVEISVEWHTRLRLTRDHRGHWIATATS